MERFSGSSSISVAGRTSSNSQPHIDRWRTELLDLLLDFLAPEGPELRPGGFAPGQQAAGHVRFGVGADHWLPGTDDVGEFVIGDGGFGGAVEDVIEPGDGVARSLAEFLEELDRMHDTPPRVGRDVDKALVARGDEVGIAVPFKNAMFEIIDMLNQGQLPIPAGLGALGPGGISPLRDEALLPLLDDIGAIENAMAPTTTTATIKMRMIFLGFMANACFQRPSAGA